MNAQASNIGNSEARPYILNEDLSTVSVSAVDKKLSNAEKIGGMVARNPDNHDDQWFIASDYWNKNFGPIVQDFGWALKTLKNGQRVQRKGWNGKGMYLIYFSPVAHGVEVLRVYDCEKGTALPLLPFILMKTADNMYVPWLASQTDLLAEDWETAGKETI